MAVRSNFTTITAVPRGMSRESVLAFLHSHDRMIDLNTLVISWQTIPAPADANSEELNHDWYSITDQVGFLPGSAVVNGKGGEVEYAAAFHNLPFGVQTHYRGPIGVDIRATWSLNGFLPGEERQVAGQTLEGIPKEGLYIREDVELSCNVLHIGFVRQTLSKRHQVLVARLAHEAKRAEMAVARQAEVVRDEAQAGLSSMMKRHSAQRARSQQPSRPQEKEQKPVQQVPQRGRSNSMSTSNIPAASASLEVEHQAPRCMSLNNNAATADQFARRPPSFKNVGSLSPRRQSEDCSDRGPRRSGPRPYPHARTAAYTKSVQPPSLSTNPNGDLALCLKSRLLHNNVRHVRHGDHDHSQPNSDPAKPAQRIAHGAMRPQGGRNHGSAAAGAHGQHIISHTSASSSSASVTSSSTASSSASRTTSHRSTSSLASSTVQPDDTLPSDTLPSYAPPLLGNRPLLQQAPAAMATDMMAGGPSSRQPPPYLQYQYQRQWHHNNRSHGSSNYNAYTDPRAMPHSRHPSQPQFEVQPQLQHSQLHHSHPRLNAPVAFTMLDEMPTLPSPSRAAPLPPLSLAPLSLSPHAPPPLSHSPSSSVSSQRSAPPTPPASTRIYTPPTLHDGHVRKASNGDAGNPYPDPLRVSPRPVLSVITPGSMKQRAMLPQVPLALRIGAGPTKHHVQEVQPLDAHQRQAQEAVVNAWVASQQREAEEAAQEERRRFEKTQASIFRQEEDVRAKEEDLRRRVREESARKENELRLQKAREVEMKAAAAVEIKATTIAEYVAHPNYPFMNPYADDVSPIMLKGTKQEELFNAVVSKGVKGKGEMKRYQLTDKPLPDVVVPTKDARTKSRGSRLSNNTLVLKTQMMSAHAAAASSGVNTATSLGSSNADTGLAAGATEQIVMSATLSGPWQADMPDEFMFMG